MNILVIHGPNLDLLGVRQPEIYGRLTLRELNARIRKYALAGKVRTRIRQSNHEGGIIDLIGRSRSWADALIINPAAYTHYSYAIRDAIQASGLPAVEVHFSDIMKREPFRRKSVTKDVCIAQIRGLGAASYLRAIDLCRAFGSSDGKKSPR